MSGLIEKFRETIIKDNRSQLWIVENAQYITMMGSRAYDTYTETSDYDMYGFTIPPKDVVFPFHYGYIYGFSNDVPNFEQYQKSHIPYNDTEVDFQMYNIVKYFKLIGECNPNMIDSLFTKREYVTKCTEIGEMVRLKRKMFLHKGAYHKFFGYAYSQLKKAKSQVRVGKRKAIVEEFGFDVKYAGHIIRLLDECEQILLEGDIDLTRASEKVKAVHRGEVTLEEIAELFKRKEVYITKLYEESKLRHSPDWDALKDLLMECLEHYYGNMDKFVSKSTGDYSKLVRAIDDLLVTFR